MAATSNEVWGLLRERIAAQKTSREEMRLTERTLTRQLKAGCGHTRS